jgi:hypothetical protein
VVKWWLVPLFAAFLCGSFIAATSVAQSDPYRDMVVAIEKWLQSNPARQFTSAQEEKVFAWKVGLERLGYSSKEGFLFYSQLLSEIGSTAFAYNSRVYSEPSVRAKLFESYPTLEYLRGDKQLPAPGSVFAETYDWYRSNVVSRQEQCYWLQLFLKFFEGFTLGPQQLAALVSTNREAIHEILVQYLAMAAIYLTDDREQIGGIGYVYTVYGLVIETRPLADVMLAPLASFCEATASYLTAEEKAGILAFVIPDYADSDYAVQLYATLNP